MDVSSLKRDTAKIHTIYTEQPDGSVIANRDFEVYIPKRFTENGMATIGDVVETVAVMGLVIPGECYAPLVALLNLTLVPLAMREESVKGVRYIVLEFTKGDTFIANATTLQEPNQPYFYFMEFLVYAKIPWYMSQGDLTGLFDNAKQESGDTVGSSPQVMRIFNSIMLRDPDNPDNPYRYSKAMLENRPPMIVGMNNTSMLIEGVFPKITGGYLQDNTLAAIVNPDTRVTDLEMIIRGIPYEQQGTDL